MTKANPWAIRAWRPSDLTVGPCAWWSTALSNTPDEIQDKPSLVAVHPDHDAEHLNELAPLLASLREQTEDRMQGTAPWPVMLGLHEPSFARRLPELVRRDLEALALPRIEVLTLWIEDPQDLKSGGLLQTMFAMRDEGLVRYIGIACEDALVAEWVVMNTAARVIAMPHHLTDQSARHRALDTAEEHGYVCLATGPHTATPEAMRFALGSSDLALPVLDAPPPPNVTPMDPQQIESCWSDFQAKHPSPPPLPRGRPPGA